MDRDQLQDIYLPPERQDDASSAYYQRFRSQFCYCHSLRTAFDDACVICSLV